MKMPSRLEKVDPSSITGPYQLFGLSLLVVEGLLGYWLFRAQGAGERSFTGLVMLLIFFALVYAVIRMTQVPPPQAETLLKPPEGEATETEIASPAPETIPAPDRSYLINLPPEGWRVRELSSTDWYSEGMGIKDSAAKDWLLGSADQRREILVFEREKQISIIPIPGQTIIDGRKFPTALEVETPTQLAIIPIERAQPPLFVERPLEHNFLKFVGQILNSGVMTVRMSESGFIASTGRRYMTVELRQEIKNAIVNGREGQDVVTTVSVIGIQGELGDHLLITKYTTVPGDPNVERDLQTLKTLATSFRPLRIINVEEKRREIAALADKKFKELMAEKGELAFGTEFVFLLLRLQGVNLDDPETRLHAMKLLKPFEVFARAINLQDEEFEALWKALHQAEAGNATDFKANLTELIKDAISETEKKQAEQAALPPVAEGEPEEPGDPSEPGAPS